MGKTRFIVGVTGPSNSFKTTTCEKAQARGVGAWLRGDHFYGHQPPPITQDMKDYESPEAIDLAHMAETVALLRKGVDSVVIPEYDRVTHRRTGRPAKFTPSPALPSVILLDSLFAAEDPVYAHLDLCIVLDISEDLLWTRRRERQGDAYTLEYHERVMVPSIHRARRLWQTRANLYLPLTDAFTSDHLTAYLEEFLEKRLAA